MKEFVFWWCIAGAFIIALGGLMIHTKIFDILDKMFWVWFMVGICLVGWYWRP